MIALQTEGSQIVYPMKLTGEAKSYSIRAEKRTDQTGIGLLTTVVLSNLMTTDELIILACEECN